MSEKVLKIIADNQVRRLCVSSDISYEELASRVESLYQKTFCLINFAYDDEDDDRVVFSTDFELRDILSGLGEKPLKLYVSFTPLEPEQPRRASPSKQDDSDFVSEEEEQVPKASPEEPASNKRSYLEILSDMNCKCLRIEDIFPNSPIKQELAHRVVDDVKSTFRKVTSVDYHSRLQTMLPAALALFFFFHCSWLMWILLPPSLVVLARNGPASGKALLSAILLWLLPIPKFVFIIVIFYLLRNEIGFNRRRKRCIADLFDDWGWEERPRRYRRE